MRLAPGDGRLAAARCYCACAVVTDALAPHPLQATMPIAAKYVTFLAVAAVSLVLLAGFWNMMRGSNPNLSQKLMRWRVALQFLAILIAMILVYLLRP